MNLKYFSGDKTNFLENLELVSSRDETQSKSRLVLKIYKNKSRYLYSLDIKLGTFVRSFYPDETSEDFFDAATAQRAAIQKIKDTIKNSRKQKKFFALFGSFQMEGQPTLFDF